MDVNLKEVWKVDEEGIMAASMRRISDHPH